MLRDWFIISSATLTASLLFCTALMWTMRGSSRPRTVLAAVSTTIFAFMALLLAFFYLRQGYRPEILDFSYSMVCIAVVCLIRLYFRLLMQPWSGIRKPLRVMFAALAGFCAVYGLLSLLCPPVPAIHTFGELAAGLGHPVVMLRVAAFMAFAALLAVFIVSTLRIYMRHREAIAARFSFREKISLSWIPSMIALYVVYGICTVFDQCIGELGPGIVVVHFFYAGFYVVINLMGVYQQDVYTETEARSEAGIADGASAVAAPNGNGMPARVRDKLRNDLVRLMETEHRYRNQELRLDDVVGELSTNRTYLSIIIREDFGENFIGFVNGYRIREAKDMLTGGGAPLPMTEIAELVGFKSISSFNTFFKKDTGVSPTQFRKTAGM
ncbi:MAG: helix-turn-helix transcriptional regulator [Bacteroidales bacterium]|jgi:AraC-like DNA-binding protein|nr:helix-turn-helix transcriptional regulator [Bacteroidales bacterium]